jgi:hypothetical protein
MSPHLACQDFLSALGESREWIIGRHRLDACKALALVFARLQPIWNEARGAALTLPAYLTRMQAGLLATLAEKARMALLGSVRAPLAAAWTVYATEPWTGLALVIDADDHALSASTVLADNEQLFLQSSQSWPALSVRAWKERLLHLVADCCIRQSRRDPRDSASAEQALYDQLDNALDQWVHGKVAEMLIQTTNWYQNLFLQPDEIATFCDRLASKALDGIHDLFASEAARDALRLVLLTPTAQRLPGLAALLEKHFAEMGTMPPLEPSGDFGEGLLQAHAGPVRLHVLPPDSGARAAHELAARFQRGNLPRGFLDPSIPLPRNTPATPVTNVTKRTFRLFSAENER